MGRFLGGPGLFTRGGTQRRLFAHPYDNAILKIPTHVREVAQGRGLAVAHDLIEGDGSGQGAVRASTRARGRPVAAARSTRECG